MLHQVITADPEIDRAIEDTVEVVLETVDQLRQVSARALTFKEGSDARRADDEFSGELTDRIALAAARIDLSPDALIELANARLNRAARRGKGEPARTTSRTLADALTVAIGKEAAAHRALSEAQAAVIEATRARIAAQEAHEIYAQRRQAQ